MAEADSLDLDVDTSSDEYMKNLLDAIDAEEVETLGIDVSDRFEIRTREQADYLTKQYLALKQETDEIEQTAQNAKDAYGQKVDSWKERELSPRMSSMDWIASRLRVFAEQQLAGSKRRSLNLISGALKFKKRAGISYDDEVLREYLMQNAPEFMKEQPKKIDKAGLRKACEVRDGRFYYNGQLVEGIDQTEMPDSFFIA